MKPGGIQSFGAVYGENPKLLILGSMPGVASLNAREYYAHPRNRFWPLMAALVGRELPDRYEDRLQMLTDHGIALWDVLAECERSGSLDASIDTASQQPNRIGELIAACPEIRTIATNGGHASRTFVRFFPALSRERLHIALPSTSPANARWPMPALIEAWSVLAQHLDGI